jgi:hypothetical protein
LLIANGQNRKVRYEHTEKCIEGEEKMKMREFWPILLAASLELTESIQAQWTKEKAAEKARLEHMTNYQVMAELVQDPRSDLSDSTTQEIVRLAQLDAIAFAKRHRKVSMEEASKRVFEKSHAGAILFSIRRIEARSIIVSEVCTRYS